MIVRTEDATYRIAGGGATIELTKLSGSQNTYVGTSLTLKLCHPMILQTADGITVLETTAVLTIKG